MSIVAGPPLAHIGILVADLETSRERWSRVLPWSFSPITRYRPANWSDLGNPNPHLHDARLTFYLGDRPSIEILEFVGNGTHSPERGEGGHHISFPPVRDNAARRRELADLGIGIDGEIFHDSRWIFLFSDARALNNVYTEWVEEHPDHADTKDDLSPINRLPDGTKTLFDVATIEELGGIRPSSEIVEIGVSVAALDSAIVAWNDATGYLFSVDADNPASAVSFESEPTIRLIQNGHSEGREGLFYAVIRDDDLAATSARFGSSSVPFTQTKGEGGELEELEVDAQFLNGFTLRFRTDG